jgi:hypothetical protein
MDFSRHINTLTYPGCPGYHTLYDQLNFEVKLVRISIPIRLNAFS